MTPKDLKEAIQAGIKTAKELAKYYKKEVALYAPNTNKKIELPKRKEAK